MALSKLTEQQNFRLKNLEAKMKKAVGKGDLAVAKSLAYDIQSLLRPIGYETRLMQVKNWLYETGIEAGDYIFAIDGLKAVQLKTDSKTRVHLEATALLAIAYIRNNDIGNAQPEIRKVLTNDKVIKSDKKRSEFRKSIIERFNEEVSLFALKGSGEDFLNIDEIQADARNMAEFTDESHIYKFIGTAYPPTAIHSLFQIDNFSKKLLPTSERLKLPSPQANIEPMEVGKTLFQSIKRTLYRSLCDPESDIYKAWFTNGIQMVLSKKYISTAVIGILTSLGIGIKLIATSVIALVIKFGIEVYCTHNKPTGIMELR